MIEWFAAYWPWLSTALVFAPYLVKLSRFVSLLGFLGPFAEPVRVFLEGAAKALSIVFACVFKSLWHCCFNPATWGALITIYFVGGFYPAQNVAGKLLKKRPAVVQPVAAKKSSKRRSDAGAETRRNFMR